MDFVKKAGRLIGDQKRRLRPSVILSFADSALNSCMYFIMFFGLISLADGSFSASRLKSSSAAIAVIVILRMIVQSVAFTNAQCTGSDISYRIRQSLGNHIRNLGLGFFNENSKCGI